MAAAFLDAEIMCAEIKALIISKLNTKLTALDSEKNDGMTLAQIDSNAFLLQSMGQNVMAYSPFIFYGLEDIQTTGMGPVSHEKCTFFVALILPDNGQDGQIANRMFRYNRALKEIFHENWSEIPRGLKVKIESVAPYPWKFLNRGEPDQITGVTIEVNVA